MALYSLFDRELGEFVPGQTNQPNMGRADGSIPSGLAPNLVWLLHTEDPLPEYDPQAERLRMPREIVNDPADARIGEWRLRKIPEPLPEEIRSEREREARIELRAPQVGAMARRVLKSRLPSQDDVVLFMLHVIERDGLAQLGEIPSGS